MKCIAYSLMFISRNDLPDNGNEAVAGSEGVHSEQLPQTQVLAASQPGFLVLCVRACVFWE